MEDHLSLWKKAELINFNKGFYVDYLLERLFGINIKKEI